MSKKSSTYSNISPDQFNTQILSWFDQHGRKNLPWQQHKSPYRVWISEIMLQQTQVRTVIDYFLRFMEKFPDISTLAAATEDEVLHLWTGLGYYQRARNLHKTAKIICDTYQSSFPNTLPELEALPGIGRSTAGAILSIAFNCAAPILDGNVKRVLTRFHGITDWPAEKNTLELLWNIATQYTPKQRTADYTQAMMDLGATLCTRGKPNCIQCPLQHECIAYKQGIAAELPRSKPRKILPIRTVTLLIILQKPHFIFLEKRCLNGVWKGLWSFPEMEGFMDNKAIKQACFARFRFDTEEIKLAESFRHTFSHYHLDIQPAFITIKKTPAKIMDDQQQIWYNLKHSQPIGMPAPVKALLNTVEV